MVAERTDNVKRFKRKSQTGLGWQVWVFCVLFLSFASLSYAQENPEAESQYKTPRQIITHKHINYSSNKTANKALENNDNAGIETHSTSTQVAEPIESLQINNLEENIPETNVNPAKGEYAFDLETVGHPKEDFIQKKQLPEYKPGEVIIKFKEEAGQKIDKQFSRATLEVSPRQTGISTIDFLNSKHKVSKMSPVFKQLKKEQFVSGLSAKALQEKVKAKFPKRSQRAPKGVEAPDLTHIYKLNLEDKKTDILAICEEYKKDPNVEYCEPNYISHISTFKTDDGSSVGGSIFPNDPFFWSSGSWGQTYDDLWGLKKIRADLAWDITQGEGVIVAVVDTGLDYNHPDIAENVWINPNDPIGDIPDNCDRNAHPEIDPADDDCNGFVDDVKGYDFTTCETFDNYGVCITTKQPDNDPMDGHGHGTHVSGTIAAVGNNGIGVIGVAPKAKILPLKGLSDQGWGYDTDLAEAVIYAINNGVDVINNSWGGYGSSQVLFDVFNQAYALGVVCVAAAGNDDFSVSESFPASYPYVITVSATNHNDKRASFSNYGEKIDVAAPGGDGNRDSWFLRQSEPNAFRGSYSFTEEVGSFCIISPIGYQGDSGALYTLIGPDRGIVDVFLNDEFLTSLDNYSPTVEFAKREFALPSPLTRNKFEFRVSENKNPLSTGHRFDIDRIEVPKQGGKQVFDDLDFYFSDKSDIYSRDNILSLRAANTDMFGDGRRIVNSDYFRLRGTSMAAPHVSGLAALIISKARELSFSLPPELVKTIIKKSAKDILISGKDIYSGNGLINAYDALIMTQDYLGNQTPDLQIANGVLRLINSEEAQIAFEIINSGLSSATNVPYRIYSGELAAGKMITEGTIPTLAANSHDAVSFNYSIVAFPDEFLTIQVDPNNQIPEYFEDNNEARIIFLNLLLPGWPKRLEGSGFLSAIADIDGDGEPEIVASSRKWDYGYPLNTLNFLYAFKADGTVVPGWPIMRNGYMYSEHQIADLDGDGRIEVVFATTGGINVLRQSFTNPSVWENCPGWPKETEGILTSFIVVDLNGDSFLEIVACGEYVKKVYAWDFNGNVVPGWPMQTGFSLYEPILSAEDLDNDGQTEIIIYSYGQVYVLQSNGSLRPNWPQRVTDELLGVSLAIADLDGDDMKEIIAPNNSGKVYIWHPDGTTLEGWPKQISSTYVGADKLCSPIVGDMDGDGSLEIIVGGGQDYLVYALHSDGSMVAGWPQHINSDKIQDLALVDIDGDKKLEVVATVSEWDTDKVYMWHNDGTLVKGWPQQSGGLLAIADIDGNGTPEIVKTSGLGVWAFNILGAKPYDSQAWPMYHHDLKRTGVYTHVNKPPILNEIGNKTVDESQLLEFTVNATDPDNDSLSYSASNLPQGASFDTTTQTFSWTPDFSQAGSYSITFTVSDGEISDSETIIVTVNNVNRAPVLNPIGNKTVCAGNTLSFFVSATDPDEQSFSLSYSVANLPSGAQFYRDSLILSKKVYQFKWTPTFSQIGTYNVAFTVTDSQGATDSETITIRVRPKVGGKPPFRIPE